MHLKTKVDEQSIITVLHNEQLQKLNIHFFRRNKVPSQVKVNNKKLSSLRQLSSLKQQLQKSTGEHNAAVRLEDEMKIRTCHLLQLLVLC